MRLNAQNIKKLQSITRKGKLFIFLSGSFLDKKNNLNNQRFVGNVCIVVNLFNASNFKKYKTTNQLYTFLGVGYFFLVLFRA